MKKVCIAVVSLLVATSLVLGTVSLGFSNFSQDISLCDLDYERVCY